MFGGKVTWPGPGVVKERVMLVQPQAGGTAVAFAQYAEGKGVLNVHRPFTSPVTCVAGTSVH
jgi:hypothetical protein